MTSPRWTSPSPAIPFHRARVPIHRIKEPLKLEETSKIMKSNHQPNTIIPTKPCPEVPFIHVFWTSPGMVTPPLPWTAYSNVDHFFSKELFLNIQLKPPLTQLEVIASPPITSYLGEETSTCLTATSFQVAVESNKVPPQPLLLQTKQLQFPQLLLIRLVR